MTYLWKQNFRMESHEISEIYGADDNYVQRDEVTNTRAGSSRGRTLAPRGKKVISPKQPVSSGVTNPSEKAPRQKLGEPGENASSLRPKKRRRGKTRFYQTKKGRGKGRTSVSSLAGMPGETADEVQQSETTELREFDESTKSFVKSVSDKPAEAKAGEDIHPSIRPQTVNPNNTLSASTDHFHHSYTLPLSAMDTIDRSHLSVSAAHQGKLNEYVCEPVSIGQVEEEGRFVLGTEEIKIEESPYKTVDVLENWDILGIQRPPLEQCLIDDVLKILKERLPQHWICLPEERGVHVVLISRVKEKAIQRRIFFPYCEGSEEFTVHRKPVPESISKKVFQDALCKKVILCEETKNRFVDYILSVVNNVCSYDICMGVFEDDYKIFWDLEALGEVDKNYYGERRYEETFRPHNCDLLVSTMPSMVKRCHLCLLKKKNFHSRVQKKDSEKFPHTRNTYLSREELLKKMEQKQRDLENARSQIVTLKKALEIAISEEGEELDENDSNK